MAVPQPQILPAQQISLLDIYTKQIEMQGKLDMLTHTLPDHENRIRANEARIPENLSGRLIALEKWRYGLPLAGIMAAGSMALTVWGILHQ